MGRDVSLPDDPPQALGVASTHPRVFYRNKDNALTLVFSLMFLAELGAVFDRVAATSLQLTAQLEVDVCLTLKLVFKRHLRNFQLRHPLQPQTWKALTIFPSILRVLSP